MTTEEVRKAMQAAGWQFAIDSRPGCYVREGSAQQRDWIVPESSMKQLAEEFSLSQELQSILIDDNKDGSP